ncbi:MAG TPA: YjgN family protein [Rhodocyclaceae bacterium]
MSSTDPAPPEQGENLKPEAPRPGQPTELKLRFDGTASEYFRIWVVNLCLTLATLGIFSAWAKVRKKRYFYSHTVLDGTPFQYLGQPLPILKGRLVAVVLFAIYYAASHFFTSLLPVVIAAGLVIAPWAIARSAAFTARYSAYRNMTFSFTGDYRGTLRATYWLGLIPIIATGIAFQTSEVVAGGTAAIVFGIAFAVFGILFPWWLARFKKFLMSSTAFGGVSADMNITGGQLWSIYFRGGLLIAAGGVVVGGTGAVLVGVSHMPSYLAGALGLASFYVGYVLGYAYIKAASTNLVWSNTTLGPLRFVSTLRGRGLAWLYLSNAIAIVASLALLTPWAVVRTLKYRADHMQVVLDGELTAFSGSDTSSVQAAGAEVSEVFDLDLSL